MARRALPTVQVTAVMTSENVKVNNDRDGEFTIWSCDGSEGIAFTNIDEVIEALEIIRDNA